MSAFSEIPCHRTGSGGWGSRERVRTVDPGLWFTSLVSDVLVHCSPTRVSRDGTTEEPRTSGGDVDYPCFWGHSVVDCPSPGRPDRRHRTVGDVHVSRHRWFPRPSSPSAHARRGVDPAAGDPLCHLWLWEGDLPPTLPGPEAERDVSSLRRATEPRASRPRVVSGRRFPLTTTVALWG